MYEFEFEGYSPKQCEAYLKRIDAEFDGKADLENLNRLIRLHQARVPFEDLALKEGWGKVETDREALFKKIVKDRRGGFCFELNGAFLLLLKGLGYDVAGLMCRVGVPFIGSLLRLDHCGILAVIEGQEYYLDVGMGGPKPAWAVKMTGEREPVDGVCFWVEDTYRGWKMLKNDMKDSDGACIIIAPVAMLPEDLHANCKDLVARGDSLFHNVRMVNINTDDGFVMIENDTIKISREGKASERTFTEEEYPGLLKEYFGLIR